MSNRSLMIVALMVLASSVALAETPGVAWLAPSATMGASAAPDAYDARILLGVSLSDLGDFGTDFGVRAMWSRGNWLLSGGWNNVDDHVPSLGESMKVKGDLWQADVSYLWWNDEKATESKHWGGDWYFGAGPGVRNIDAKWTVAGISKDAKKLEYTGHVCAGAQFNKCFFDVRYVIGPNLFGYEADGGQVTFGLMW